MQRWTNGPGPTPTTTAVLLSDILAEPINASLLPRYRAKKAGIRLTNYDSPYLHMQVSPEVERREVP